MKFGTAGLLADLISDHPWIFWQSAWGFWFCEGSNFAIFLYSGSCR